MNQKAIIREKSSILLVLIFILLGWATVVGLYVTTYYYPPDFQTHFMIVCLMALTLAVVYLSIQVRNLGEKLVKE
jgi:hypothetical protein